MLVLVNDSVSAPESKPDVIATVAPLIVESSSSLIVSALGDLDGRGLRLVAERAGLHVRDHRRVVTLTSRDSVLLRWFDACPSSTWKLIVRVAVVGVALESE